MTQAHIESVPQKRYFAAIPVSAAIIENLIDWSKSHGLSLPWVDPMTAHITLNYFGALPQEEVDKLRDKLSKIVAQPISLIPTHISAFLSSTTGQSITSAAIKDAPDLTALHNRIRQSLEDVGQLTGAVNHYIPHITLARASGNEHSEIAAKIKSIPTLTPEYGWIAEKFCLYESVADNFPEASQYRLLSDHRLQNSSSTLTAQRKDFPVSQPLTNETMIAYGQELLKDQEKIEAAWLIGSYGRGDNDRYSDFDFCAYSPASTDADEVFRNIREAIEKNTAIVFSKVLPQGRTVNAITQDWERIDITIIDKSRITDTSRDGIKFLYGRDKVENLMRVDTTFDPARDKADTQNTIYEFIRVLGLLPVVLGRNDYVVGQTGAQLLRDMLVKLMIRENSDGVIHGVLSMRKAISSQQYSVLEQVPPIFANKDALLKSYKYLAAEFFERGKRISETQGLVWPSRFEEATRRSLQAKLGLAI